MPEHRSEQFQGKTLQLLVPNSKRLRGYTQIDPRSATWFRTGKYSGNACSCSETWRNKKKFLELHHEELRDLSISRSPVLSLNKNTKSAKTMIYTELFTSHKWKARQARQSARQIKKVCQDNNPHIPSCLQDKDIQAEKTSTKIKDLHSISIQKEV